jgi:6-phosphofructokinase 1
LSIRYAVAAAELVKNRDFGKMVCLTNGQMSSVSLEDVIGKNKYVEKHNELVQAALKMGISFASDEIG